jgi:protein ImuB
MRLACVYVPQLALQSVLRRAPELRGAPAVLLGTARDVATAGKAGGAQNQLLPNQAQPGKAKGKLRVLELTAEARRAGAVPGMTAAQASAVCPGVRLLSASPADVEAAEGALADIGYAFAPRVEAEPERVFFEVEDLGHLYPLGEGAITQAVQAQAARVGLEARVAIASRKGTARVATRAHELCVVPADGARARAFLAPIPVDRLTSDAELRAAFRRWGTRTAGQVAALPADAVALRLGESGARACRLARGEDDEPFMPRLPADALEEAVDLDYRIYELEPLTFVLRGLVDRALARLAGRSLACAGLTVRLTLDPRGLDVRAVPIAAPTRDSATLIQLLRLDLARRPPDAPVVGARIVALPARVRATQLDILRPAGPAPDRLAATIARLAALVGPENVGAPAAEDCWREEAVVMTSFALTGGSPPAASDARPFEGPPPLAIRRLRPAQEIEVLMGRGGPTALRGRDTTARVLVAAGPYQASGEWWRDEGAAEGGGGGFARAYWDVHASDGAVYRLHEDRRDGRWFLDGYYD